MSNIINDGADFTANKKKKKNCTCEQKDEDKMRQYN